MYRQGDVLIIPVDSVPSNTETVPRDQGRIVLAYGEVTGHAHAIVAPYAALVAKGAERFLTVKGTKAAFLRHEEHREIRLPPGNYQIIRQREYTPEEVRNVAD